MTESEKLRKKLSALELQLDGIEQERDRLLSGGGDDGPESLRRLEMLSAQRVAALDLKAGISARLGEAEKTEAIEARKTALVEYSKTVKHQALEAKSVIQEVLKNLENLEISLEKARDLRDQVWASWRGVGAPIDEKPPLVFDLEVSSHLPYRLDPSILDPQLVRFARESLTGLEKETEDDARLMAKRIVEIEETKKEAI